MDGADLEFRDDGLSAVARKAMSERQVPAAWRTILENVLLDTMYQLPSLKNVSKVVVDESVVQGHAPPYVVYKSDDPKPEKTVGRRTRAGASGISR